MAEKVKVSREVAEAIEHLLANLHWGYTYTKILETHAGMEKYPKRTWSEGPAEVLNDIELLDLAKILSNGYEIELTPEEKLLEKFNWIKDEYKKAFDKGDDFYISKYQGMFDGVKFSLETLGIKIEGINK